MGTQRTRSTAPWWARKRWGQQKRHNRSPHTSRAPPLAAPPASSGGVVAAPRDAAQLRETEVAAGWRPRRGRVVTPRCVLLWHSIFLSSSSWAPRAGKESSSRRPPPPSSSPLQRPGQAGDEKTPRPLRIAPQAPAGNKSATRERVFFCGGLAARRPMPSGLFFSLSFY